MAAGRHSGKRRSNPAGCRP